MNILVVSDFETKGGAAIATRRISDAIVKLGHSVHYAVCRTDADCEKSTPLQTDVLHWRSESSILRGLTRKFLPPQGRKASDERVVERSFTRLLERVRPDVVNFSNIHNAVSAGWSDGLLPIASRFAPVCWTLHDMWSFTGRCAYAHGCERFVTGCNAQCPTAGEYPAMQPELIAPAWLRRQAVFAQLPELAAIAVSGWMAAEAKRGLWCDHEVKVIHNGLPLERYELLDAAACRTELGVQSSGPVLLAVAMDWRSPHKGGALLVEAMRAMESHKPTLLLLGGGELPGDLTGLRLVKLGLQSQERFKAVAMSAADCLVHPATAENFSNVLVEAAACGLLAAVFGVGGNAEIVADGRTGCIAGAVTGAGLAAAVERTLTMAQAEPGLRQRIRAEAEGRFAVKLQAERYIAFYRQLIDRRSNLQGVAGAAIVGVKAETGHR